MFTLIACKEAVNKDITHMEDYNQYLSTTHLPSYEEAISEKTFWSSRLTKDTSGIGDIAPLAGAYEKLFAETGEVQYLRNAEILYKKVFPKLLFNIGMVLKEVLPII